MSIISPIPRSNVLPVVFSTDAQYAEYLPTVLHSLLTRLNPGWMCDVLVFVNELPEACRRKLKRFGDGYGNCLLRFVDVPRDFVENTGLKPMAHVSMAGYYRMLAAALLPEYHKVLYLDIDTVVLGDLQKLYEIELGDNYLAAAPDVGFMVDGRFKEYARNELQLPPSHVYFNSGVLLLNLDLWRKENLFKKAVEIFNSNDKIRFGDQCVLNLLCQGHTLVVSNAWNYQYHGLVELQDSKLLPMPPQIVHYLQGEAKPWQHPFHPLTQIWWTEHQQAVSREGQYTLGEITDFCISI